MRPVNLIPEKVKRRMELRDTGMAPYVLIALIAAAVIATLGYVLLHNQVSSRKAKLGELKQQVQSYQADAAALAPYARFATGKEIRVSGVKMIAEARFPWYRVLKDISLAFPSNAWLTKMQGRVSSDVNTSAKGSSAGGNESGEKMIDVPGPAVQLIGCSYGQREVARMMTRLRNIPGVAQVLLDSSKKKEETGSAQGGTSGGETSGDCRVSSDITKFNITITFPPEEDAMLTELAAATSSTSGASSTTQAKGTVQTANQSQAKSSGGGG